MLDKYQAFIFDIDDTLYLELDYVYSGFSALGTWVAHEFDIHGFGVVCCELFEQGARHNVIDQALHYFKVPSSDDLVRQMVSVYRSHQPEIELTTDAKLTLERLSQAKQVAFLTGGPIESQKAKVEALGLSQYSEKIIYSGALGSDYDKPHPQAWRRMQQMFTFPVDEMIYIGDNPLKDFESPISLGWSVVRIRRPGGINFEIETLLEIPEIETLTSLLI